MLAHLFNGSFRLQTLATVAILGCCLMGCDSSPRLMQVTGSISVKGKPAEGAILLFHSEISDSVTPSAAAEADGTFSIRSGLDMGIAPGKYKVSVTWPDASVKPTQAQIMMGLDEPGPDLLKGKYASKGNTTLTAEITTSTTTLPPFEL